jgi:uncharacterized phage-associated protein
MATIFDVAKYILEKTGPITVMKLQKLSFYTKAWGLVWDEEEMFPEEFQAWAGGAVSPALYDKHRGFFKVNVSVFADADTEVLTRDQKETIDKVLNFYNKYTAQQLSDINHQESPWIDARGGLPPAARSNVVITIDSMAEYYSGVWNGKEGEQE